MGILRRGTLANWLALALIAVTALIVAGAGAGGARAESLQDCAAPAGGQAGAATPAAGDSGQSTGGPVAGPTCGGMVTGGAGVPVIVSPACSISLPEGAAPGTTIVVTADCGVQIVDPSGAVTVTGPFIIGGIAGGIVCAATTPDMTVPAKDKAAAATPPANANTEADTQSGAAGQPANDDQAPPETAVLTPGQCGAIVIGPGADGAGMSCIIVQGEAGGNSEAGDSAATPAAGATTENTALTGQVTDCPPPPAQGAGAGQPGTASGTAKSANCTTTNGVTTCTDQP